MIPGLSSKDMMKAMKKLGVKQEEIDAIEVIIKCPSNDLIIQNPQVLKINMMGQETYQISGTTKEITVSKALAISEEDIKTVMEQAGVNRDDALNAIKEHKGDLALAILKLTS